MKKIISITLVIIIVLLACVTTSAEVPNTNVLEIDHVTVIFEEDSVFSLEEKQYIAELIAYGDRGISTYGLACIFGHKYVEESVTAITHCAKENQPRCLAEVFLVSTCSRCGKSSMERVTYYYFTCCP